MNDLVRQVLHSVSGKAIFIAALILALLIPVKMIEGVVDERAWSMAAAVDDIAGAWGGDQIIGGPILVVPFRYTTMRGGVSASVRDELYVLPTELAYTGDVTTEIRYRGIYEVPVYTAQLTITGTLPAVNVELDYDDVAIDWEHVTLVLPISDARSVRQAVELVVEDVTADFEPGGTPVAGFGQQLSVPYAALGLDRLDVDRAFSFELTLSGLGGLGFLPLGDTTSVELSSAWPSPSFAGAYLPESREVSDAGFSASWNVLHLGRGYPSRWYRSLYSPHSIESSAFGVDLIVPAGVYQSSARAAKYAILFIGLSFLIYFVFELSTEIRLHPLQYLLVGLANCMFYLLLLAVSEHTGFAIAYFLSAVASTALVAAYSSAVLGVRDRVVPVVVALATMYIYLFVTLRAENYALLSGTFILFVVLAFFMFATRRVDWYALDGTDAASID
ncbi:MAG TPA: cell envelope integrity protein CreD [Gammaproteobacteria bacterium]